LPLCEGGTHLIGEGGRAAAEAVAATGGFGGGGGRSKAAAVAAAGGLGGGRGKAMAAFGLASGMGLSRARGRCSAIESTNGYGPRGGLARAAGAASAHTHTHTHTRKNACTRRCACDKQNECHFDKPKHQPIS
jgi:hypothetical protein